MFLRDKFCLNFTSKLIKKLISVIQIFYHAILFNLYFLRLNNYFLIILFKI